MFKCGITEILGEPGAGKTNFVLSQVNKYNTIIITNRLYCKDICDFNKVYIVKLVSFLDLRVFVLKRLRRIVQLLEAECIIFDSFDAFLYTERSPREYSKEIEAILKDLRRFTFKHKCKIVVVNNLVEKTSKDFTFYSKYLGYNWLYAANAKYILRKTIRNTRELLDINNKVVLEFKISGFGKIEVLVNE